jgi:hypothetical protein
MKHVAVVFAVLAAALGIATFGQVSNSSASSVTGAAAEFKPVSLKFAEQKKCLASRRKLP